MKTYIVNEIHKSVCSYRIEAENEKEAKEKVIFGDGEFLGEMDDYIVDYEVEEEEEE